MRNFSTSLCFAFLAALTLPCLVLAQNADHPGAAKMPAASAPGADLTGVWTQFPRIGGRSAGEGGFVFSREEPPMTPWAEAKLKSTKAPHTGGYTGQSDDTTLQCYPPGVPRIYLFNFPMEIFVVPGRVLIVHEFGHYIRQIWTDGRPHPKDPNPSWMGDSVGKWEGDTLVVDTIGFNDKTWLDQVGHPHSGALLPTCSKSILRSMIRRPTRSSGPGPNNSSFVRTGTFRSTSARKISTIKKFRKSASNQ